MDVAPRDALAAFTDGVLREGFQRRTAGGMVFLTGELLPDPQAVVCRRNAARLLAGTARKWDGRSPFASRRRVVYEEVAVSPYLVARWEGGRVTVFGAIAHGLAVPIAKSVTAG